MKLRSFLLRFIIICTTDIRTGVAIWLTFEWINDFALMNTVAPTDGVIIAQSFNTTTCMTLITYRYTHTSYHSEQ